MQQGWFLRAVLAIALGLGVMAGLIRADDGLPLPTPVPPYAPVINHPEPWGEPPHYSTDAVLPEWPTAPQIPVHPASLRERIHSCFAKYVVANVPAICYAHHNGPP